MAITPTRTKDEWTATCDNALETAIATCLAFTLTGANQKLERVDVLKMLAKRMLRKATQGALRSEWNVSPPWTPGA